MRDRNRFEVAFHWGKGASYSEKSLTTISLSGAALVAALRRNADRIEHIMALEAEKDAADGTQNASQ